jgi:hypothetical protein
MMEASDGASSKNGDVRKIIIRLLALLALSVLVVAFLAVSCARSLSFRPSQMLGADPTMVLTERLTRCRVR